MSDDVLEGYDKYAAPDWDYYGAEPITPDTVAYARAAITALPDYFGAPHVSPGADGTVGLEWIFKTGHIVKIFIDLGPGQKWGAFWRCRDGTHTIATGRDDQEMQAVLLALRSLQHFHTAVDKPV